MTTTERVAPRLKERYRAEIAPAPRTELTGGDLSPPTPATRPITPPEMFGSPLHLGVRQTSRFCGIAW